MKPGSLHRTTEKLKVAGFVVWLKDSYTVEFMEEILHGGEPSFGYALIFIQHLVCNSMASRGVLASTYIRIQHQDDLSDLLQTDVSVKRMRRHLFSSRDYQFGCSLCRQNHTPSIVHEYGWL